MRLRIDRFTLHSTRRRDGEDAVRYYIDIYTQPWWRVLIHKAYHRYDMNKVVHAISHRIMVGGNNELGIKIPLCAEQDMRCDRLSRKGRRMVVAGLGINEEGYESLGSAKWKSSSRRRRAMTGRSSGSGPSGTPRSRTKRPKFRHPSVSRAWAAPRRSKKETVG